MARKIDLQKLRHAFADKLLLIGGKAMEYYGLREAGADIDSVVSGRDHNCLKRMYPDDVKDLYGNLGVCAYEFEMWNQTCLFRYEFLRQNALVEDAYLVASVDKMFFLKAIAMHDAQYMKDLELLAKYANDVQYGEKKLP